MGLILAGLAGSGNLDPLLRRQGLARQGAFDHGQVSLTQQSRISGDQGAGRETDDISRDHFLEGDLTKASGTLDQRRDRHRLAEPGGSQVGAVSLGKR